MSEQPTATATRPPKAPGKTYGGLTRNQWLIVGGVFVAAVGYIIWKRRQASSAASTTGAASNVGSNECTDQNGNPVDCNEQFAQELAAMQNALDQLGAASGAGSSGGVGSGATGTVGTTGVTDGTTTSTPTTTTTQPAATPTTSTGSTKTATAAKTAGPITGLAASGVTKTSFKASWHAASNAQGYKWAVRNLATHTDQTSGQTSGTSVTVSGLKSGVDYNFGVQALPGGVGDNIHVRTT